MGTGASKKPRAPTAAAVPAAPPGPTIVVDEAASLRVKELEAEVERLRGELSKETHSKETLVKKVANWSTVKAAAQFVELHEAIQAAGTAGEEQPDGPDSLALESSLASNPDISFASEGFISNVDFPAYDDRHLRVFLLLKGEDSFAVSLHEAFSKIKSALEEQCITFHVVDLRLHKLSEKNITVDLLNQAMAEIYVCNPFVIAVDGGAAASPIPAEIITEVALTHNWVSPSATYTLFELLLRYSVGLKARGVFLYSPRGAKNDLRANLPRKSIHFRPFDSKVNLVDVVTKDWIELAKSK